MIEKNIVIDLWEKCQEKIHVVQNETLGRSIEFQLVSKGLAVNLTDCTVTFYAVKPDNTIVFNACSLVDAARGKVKYTFTAQTVVASGYLSCSLVIVDGSANEIRTQPFAIEVVASPDYTSAVESTSEYTALDTALALVTTHESRITVNESDISDIDTAIGSRTYTENNYVTDSERVTDSIDALDVGVAAHLADNMTEINKKIGNGVLASMADLSQEVKEAMTGGSVAVVGEGAVSHVNLANDVKATFDQKAEKFELNELRYGVGKLPENKNVGEGTSNPNILGVKTETASRPLVSIVSDVNTPVSNKLPYSHRVLRNNATIGSSYFADYSIPSLSSKPTIISLGFWIKDDNANIIFDATRKLQYWLYANGKYVSFDVDIKGLINDVGRTKDLTTAINVAGMIDSFSASAVCRFKSIEGYSHIVITISNIVWNTSFADFDLAKIYWNFVQVKDYMLNLPLYFANIVLLYGQVVQSGYYIYPDNVSVEQYPISESLQRQIDDIKQDMGISSNYLANKRLATAGDSITEGINPSGGYFKNYGELIAERNGMTFLNYGISGSTLSNIADHNPFTSRWNLMDSDLDYLLIWFGWNDGAYSTLGAITDTVDTTYYGAWNTILPQLIAKYPSTKIGLIAPYMSASRVGFSQAVVDVGKKWGIPVLNLDSDETPLIYLRPDVDSDIGTLRKDTFTHDGTHPNQLGYDYMSTFIEAFLRRL